MSTRKRNRTVISPSPELSSDEELDELDNEEQGEFSDDLDEERLEDVDQGDEELDLMASESDLQDSEEEEEEDMSEEEEDSEEEEQPKPPVSHTKRKKQRTVHSPAEESETEVVENRPLTKRQRARLNDDETGDYFMELPMDNGRKKILTEEEEALQKSEVARRRKNQSIQRAEKDKDDTINRLLKKQASKSKRIIHEDTADEQGKTPAERLRNKIDPNRLHYVTNQHGSQLSIPAAWTIEQVFSSPPPPSVHRQLLCEVEGCNKAKKYTCKKSTKAVCSLDHYQVMEA